MAERAVLQVEKEYLRSCCFTGHRDVPIDKYGAIWTAVETEVMKLYKSGVRTFITGGALGFDML